MNKHPSYSFEIFERNKHFSILIHFQFTTTTLFPLAPKNLQNYPNTRTVPTLLFPKHLLITSSKFSIGHMDLLNRHKPFKYKKCSIFLARPSYFTVIHLLRILTFHISSFSKQNKKYLWGLQLHVVYQCTLYISRI